MVLSSSKFPSVFSGVPSSAYIWLIQYVVNGLNGQLDFIVSINLSYTLLEGSAFTFVSES